MSEKVYRCFVEKKEGFDAAAQTVQAELSEVFRLPRIRVRLFNCYDLQNLPPERWQEVLHTVLSEPMCDRCYEETLPPLSDHTFLLCVEPLPGQFDLRADSCEQCVQMLLGGQRPLVRTALVYAIEGMTEHAFQQVKTYLINPVECREALSADKPETLLKQDNRQPDDIPVMEGFAALDTEALNALRLCLGLAMSLPDLVMIQEYFSGTHRPPTLTELRVLDTYWSDHCRHTTFNTILDSVSIQDERVKKAYNLFLSVNGDKPVTLMGIATAAMKHLRQRGELPMLDVSEENNACTVRIRAAFPHGSEDWLLFFKNETHNHPTEIEPYGGAATCIGGAIRDPLSGRAYVYQSMRITGAGDPRKPIEKTLPGKLPQRKLTTTAARGFSAYGNQIGLATGYVKELYHDGYVAKRLETGAVVGAAPLSSVRRERPAPGDVVVLLGGRTGRDGIGGATGSSKTHGKETVSECASEVQKGNAPEERKLQRLFRNPDVTKLIKRCNDFGAGGASVAIGELAEGLEITLDNLPVKYEGMDGTELALSESQERMALVVAESDLETIKRHAEAENIEATVVARITEQKKLVMTWRGKKIVDIDRSFLDTNGAKRSAKVWVSENKKTENATLRSGWFNPPNDPVSTLRSASGFPLNSCSQKGLVEHFDHSIGAASVFEPYGGKYASTETQVMAALLPAPDTRTASVMAYGFDPYLTETDSFGGSVYAVVTSVAKLVATGVALDTIHLSLQEFFPSVRDDPARWGQPFAAMLGAFSAQMGLKIAAIGGKDSMSGSFGELDVPPTLISFAVGIGEAAQLISPEFKGSGHPVYLLETPVDTEGLPDYVSLRNVWNQYTALCRNGKVLAAWVCEAGGVYDGIMKMALGNRIGFTFAEPHSKHCNSVQYGSVKIIFESSEPLDGFPLLGYTQSQPTLTLGQESFSLEQLRAAWEAPLENIFPTRVVQIGNAPLIKDTRRPAPRKGTAILRPRAVIPVFPGTNSEYDTAIALEKAGGIAEMVLIRNITPEMLQASVRELEKAIQSAQMIVLPGGFSGGDEPDGSGKYIVSLFRNPRLADAVHELIQNRDGLILGICNGFQALIKLGLLPYGRITAMTADCPTITFNRIGRHQARYVRTRVASVISPWLSKCAPGELYLQPISHGEGRWAASENLLTTLKANGQIVFQYADDEGTPSMDIEYNPNGSDWAVEGLCSADGRVLGKMGHTERCGEYVAKNIPGNKYLPLFEGGVRYFQ